VSKYKDPEGGLTEAGRRKLKALVKAKTYSRVSKTRAQQAKRCVAKVPS